MLWTLRTKRVHLHCNFGSRCTLLRSKVREIVIHEDKKLKCELVKDIICSSLYSSEDDFFF